MKHWGSQAVRSLAYGEPRGGRTPGLLHVMQALSQLS